MQTILGSGGAIGIPLAKALQQYTNDIRLVARNPEKVNETDELMPADLTQRQNVLQAIEGSKVVYVVIGFPYQYRVWKKLWIPFIKNVIEGCKQHGSKLVFFDNVYLYDPDHTPHMTEETPVNPKSKKGKIRAEVARLVQNEMEGNEIDALIARAADFYGPDNRGSVLQETIYTPLKAGQTANVLGSLHKIHNYTYTPDAGRATALLGNTDHAYNQVWHLPTSDEKWTGEDWLNAIANKLNVKPKARVATKFMMQLIGFFNPVMREIPEMMYQYTQDYFFDSSKFDEAFEFEKTSNDQGLDALMEWDEKNNSN